MAKHGVDGVYDGDPRTDADAQFLPEVTHLQAIERGLRVMDTTALSLCMDNGVPIHVFELADGQHRPGRRGESDRHARHDVGERATTDGRRRGGCDRGVPGGLRCGGWTGRSTHTRTEFNSVRTGRASAALLDRITIDYYGTPTPAHEHGDDQRPGGRGCSRSSRTTRPRSRRSRRRSWSPISA